MSTKPWVVQFLKDNGYKTFDPYQFTPEMTQKILGVLVDAYDPTLEIESSVTEPISAQANATAQADSPPNKLAVLSLALSIIACTLSVYVLVSVPGLV